MKKVAPKKKQNDDGEGIQRRSTMKQFIFSRKATSNSSLQKHFIKEYLHTTKIEVNREVGRRLVIPMKVSRFIYSAECETFSMTINTDELNK